MLKKSGPDLWANNDPSGQMFSQFMEKLLQGGRKITLSCLIWSIKLQWWLLSNYFCFQNNCKATGVDGLFCCLPIELQDPLVETGRWQALHTYHEFKSSLHQQAAIRQAMTDVHHAEGLINWNQSFVIHLIFTRNTFCTDVFKLHRMPVMCLENCKQNRKS